jgi:ribonuclease-3
VNEDLLAQVANQISLADFIILGKGELSTKGQYKPSIMASTLEAIVGGIYLDGGFEKALEVMVHLMGSIVEENLKSQTFDHDYKTRLQELTQGKCKQIPKYQVLSAEGPDHNKVFSVRVSLMGEVLGEGTGKSKKEAEQKAAFKALEKYK